MANHHMTTSRVTTAALLSIHTASIGLLDLLETVYSRSLLIAGPTKYRIGHIEHIGRTGTLSIACCSGVSAALHQSAPACLIKCSGSCLYTYTGLFCLVKINADIHSFTVIC